MEETESYLRDRLFNGTASAAEALRLYHRITDRGAPFPLELEEKVLAACLREEPHRLDLLARLRFVLSQLGKPVPDAVEEAFAQHAIQQERSRDHQRDAFEYHLKTGLKDLDEAFLPIYQDCRPFSMTSAERLFALYQATVFLTEANIPGAFVECGVWRGGSMMVAARTLLLKNCTERELYLFDTFEGLPRPDEVQDIDIWGNRAIDGWLPNRVNDRSSHWAEADLNEVRDNLLSTGYPESKIHFIKGLVEETIPAQAPDSIALLRLDTDWYESTRHELEHLYDRILPGGVLIIDDYGHFQGARKAVDDFFSTRRIPRLLNRIDYSGRLMVKAA